MHERWLVLAVLTLARTAMGFQFQSVAAVSPFLVDQFELSYAALGMLVGLYLLPGVAVALPGGMLAQRFGDKSVVCFGLAAMGIGGGLMAAAESPAALMVGRILSGAGAVPAAASVPLDAIAVGAACGALIWIDLQLFARRSTGEGSLQMAYPASRGGAFSGLARSAGIWGTQTRDGKKRAVPR